MRSDLAELCRRSGDPWRHSQQTLRVADGAETVTEGEINVRATINGQPVQHRYGVLSTLSQTILLGMDTLGRMQTSIRIKPWQWDCPDEAEAIEPTGPTEYTPAQQQALQQLLDEELRKFQTLRPTTTWATHRLRMKEGAEPTKHRYTPRNPAMQAIINQEVDKMLANGIIEPSRSPWSSPVVLVRKKNGTYRFCVDYRQVNRLTEKDAYPLPQAQDTLDKLREARFISTLDLANGYWQVPLDAASRPITAFTVPERGLFHFKVMSFGLHSAPSTFQRLLDEVVGPSLAPWCFAYLDDIIVLGRTFEEHLANLREVFRRLRAANLRLNPEKCCFGRTELKYLGHVVTSQGVRTDPDKVQAIKGIPPPRNTKELRRFLGTASWYRRFIPRFADLAAPLIRLLQKHARWCWDAEEDAAFHELRHQLASAPVLACPDFTREFTLQTDASNEALGAVLTQEFEGNEHVVAYASRSLNKAERNYSTTERKCLAIVWGIRKMRPYLEGYHFSVLTDHQAPRWLQTLDNPSGRLARWNMELQHYDFSVRYRKGEHNLVADALSRQPEDPPEEEADALDEPDQWYDRTRQAVVDDPERHPEYRIQNARLYRHIPDTSGLRPDLEWKECVRKGRRKDVLAENHDAPTAGHLGIRKTNARLAQRYYWPGMFRDAARHVRNCQSCLAHKVLQQAPAGAMYSTPTNGPWEVVTADLVGPLPRSKKGHTTLLVLQDKFTKWVELQPLRQATAPAVTRAFRERVAMRFGRPRQILTDNGRQFTSREFTTLLATYGVEHRKTPPYTPQCNPVERTNRVLKTMIAQATKTGHRDWDEWLPELAFAYNTARHEATEQTPAYLNYGRELATPGSSHLPLPTGEDRTEALDRLQDALALAQRALAKAHQARKKHYDLRRRPWAPKVGDRVMRRDHPLSAAADNFYAKLAPKFAGPFTVSERLGPTVVRLQEARGKTRTAYVQDLKPCPTTDESATINRESRNGRGNPGTRGRARGSRTREANRPAAQYKSSRGPTGPDKSVSNDADRRRTAKKSASHPAGEERPATTGGQATDNANRGGHVARPHCGTTTTGPGAATTRARPNGRDHRPTRRTTADGTAAATTGNQPAAATGTSGPSTAGQQDHHHHHHRRPEPAAITTSSGQEGHPAATTAAAPPTAPPATPPAATQPPPAPPAPPATTRPPSAPPATPVAPTTGPAAQAPSPPWAPPPPIAGLRRTPPRRAITRPATSARFAPTGRPSPAPARPVHRDAATQTGAARHDNPASGGPPVTLSARRPGEAICSAGRLSNRRPTTFTSL
ncbi:uncharacterized protein K02A2.6-like [Osmia bicornis bicornis]|uniref:uncharacterized protein K02A2.6-like n=1 Tax=Osmia bicornis bicornis TaxID=1437191 RepID=UPI0010F5FE86|nr:uncharacterized protein K02A2.6-like [Osmia bicornis bicornis]